MADETLEEIAHSFRVASAEAMSEARKVIKKGAVEVKKQMQKDAQGHRHFPGLGRSISFEMTGNQFFAEAEIGPTRGVLAGIAYFGSSRPGGATVPDPRTAADAEASVIAELLGDAGEQLAGGG